MRKKCPTLDTKRQGRVAEETPQELRPAAQAPSLAAHVTSDLVDGVRSEVRETAVLEVAPEQFHGVEFGRVGWKPDDRPARMRGHPRPHQVVLVGVAAVPDQDDRPPHVTRKMRSEEHTSELQSRPHLVCRLLLAKKKYTDGVTRLLYYLDSTGH